MKAIVLSLIAGALLGWFIASAFQANENQDNPEPVQERISLLGGKPVSGEGIPEMTILDESSHVTDILAQLESASASDIKRWLNSWIHSPGPQEEVMGIIVKHFTSLDPEEAFHFLTSKEEFAAHIPVALEEWARVDHLAALNAIAEMDPEEDWLFAVMKPLDAQAYEESLQALIDKGFDKANPRHFIRLLGEFAELRPEVAIKRAVEFGRQHEGVFADDVIRESFDVWYQDNPEDAFLWGFENLDSLAESYKHLHLSNSLRDAAIRYEGVKGLERIWKHLDSKQREALFGSEYPKTFEFPQEDFNETLEWIDQHVESPLLYSKMLAKVTNVLSGSDQPERIVEILSKLDADFDYKDFHITGISSRWAELDPDGLQEWIESLENPAIRESAIEGMLSHWSTEDPLKVAEFWADNEHLISDPRELGSMMSSLLEPNSPIDPEVILNRFPESIRDEGVYRYADARARNAPEETMRFLEAQPEGDLRDASMQKALSHWVKFDPHQAAEWVEALDDRKQKEIAYQNLADAWVRFDAGAAHAWVANQPASPHRDIAAKYIIESITHHRPNDAFTLALTVSDEESRESLIRSSLGNLARQNPDLAREQAEAAGIYSNWKDLIEGERALNELFEE